MSTYTFTGPDERYYTDLGLTAKPGDVVKLDGPLDDQWELVDGQVAPLPEQPAPDAPVVEDKPAEDDKAKTPAKKTAGSKTA